MGESRIKTLHPNVVGRVIATVEEEILSLKSEEGFEDQVPSLNDELNLFKSNHLPSSAVNLFINLSWDLESFVDWVIKLANDNSSLDNGSLFSLIDEAVVRQDEWDT